MVLLTGLPGDLESEHTLHDQLQSWLDLVAGSGQVQKLFVLCDAPGAVTLPQKLQAQVLKGDRSHFLSLGPMLAGTTNPLVVMAWGHGGKQGATPVLHVRGPRLTPADFAKVAEQVPAVESRWLLLFRESGAFAHQLAGGGRQILSSECETAFTSDPVGMSVLLKLARANAAIPFEKLAETFGRDTAAWYAERNLARTEEPTLWLGDSKPRLLAGSESGDEAPAPNRPAETARKTPSEIKADPTNPASEEAAVVQPATNDLPAVWKVIKRVEPQKYSEVDGVVLRRRLSYTLGSNPAVASEREEFIQILTPEGKSYGDFDVAYVPPYEDITFLDCEVLQPDGKLVRLDPDAIGEKREQAAGDYQPARRKFFSLPGVVPGAVLHVRYRTQWKNFPLPRISLEIPVGRDLPIVESTVEVSVPKEAPFHFGFEGITAPDPAVTQSSYGATYTWRLENLPAQRHEILTGPRDKARLLVSLFPDWAAFAGWYGRITQLTGEVTPEIAAKARELTQEAKTDREKVLAVYNYVTGLRYVAIPLGINSVRPHAAANVLQNQYGDCKDKANLFNTLLRALNIEAQLVLVPRFSRAYDALPGLAFNHAISRVVLEGKPVWVDTTDGICRFGLLPPGDPGRKVLVIDGRSTNLTQLPLPAPSEHRLQIRGQVNCAGPSDGLPMSLSAVGIGYLDYELRAMAREAREERAGLPLLAAHYRPVAGSFALEKHTATAVSALDENFSWRAEGTCVGLTSAAGGIRVLHSPFWLPKEWEQALHRRQAPLFLNRGYPLTLDEEFELALPAKAQLVTLPGLSEGRETPLRWRVEWARLRDDKLVARFHAELARGELSTEDTPALQQQLRALFAALEADATLSLTP